MAVLLEHMHLNRSDRLIQSQNESVSAVCDLLHQVCDKMDRMISTSHMLHRSTIRYASVSCWLHPCPMPHT
jgi:hypothetical protein